ncbi:MAG: DUF3096 domain-containing protein [Gammaproteobacteria bacterium]|nr:DUF3096 domain-containing protein [Gammaproteobacteria bacterium]
MTTVIHLSTTGLLVSSIVSLLFGIVVLAAPRTLNYVVALYLILAGIYGLFALYLPPSA